MSDETQEPCQEDETANAEDDQSGETSIEPQVETDESAEESTDTEECTDAQELAADEECAPDSEGEEETPEPEPEPEPVTATAPESQASTTVVRQGVSGGAAFFCFVLGLILGVVLHATATKTPPEAPVTVAQPPASPEGDAGENAPIEDTATALKDSKAQVRRDLEEAAAAVEALNFGEAEETIAQARTTLNVVRNAPMTEDERKQIDKALTDLAAVAKAVKDNDRESAAQIRSLLKSLQE